jgi:hypothetical protein
MLRSIRAEGLSSIARRVTTCGIEAFGTRLLDELIRGNTVRECREVSLSCHLTKIARLRGYVARAKDPPPGNTVM